VPMLGDAFGDMIARCWAAGATPGSAFEIVERSDGFIAAKDAITYFSPRDAWPAHEVWACDEAKGRILDIGCGAGRHAVDLWERGIEVVGLEPSRGAADVARDRGIPVIDGTIASLSGDHGTFDTFLMLGNNLGLLESREQAEFVLDRLADVSRSGARILATGNDPYATVDPRHLAYQEHNRSTGRMSGQLRLRVRDRHAATDWFDYLLVSPDELADLIAPTVWRLDEVRPGDKAGYLAVMTLP
jgi:SAM-dependent methyltransferase